MLSSPKIIAVDDDKEELQAILAGLNHLQIPAVGCHYEDEIEKSGLPSFPGARIIFLDLFMLRSGDLDSSRQIKHLIDVILRDVISPEHGPYVIVLWTKHGDDCVAFTKEAWARLPLAERPLPLAVTFLDKSEYLTTRGGVRVIIDPMKFYEAIRTKIFENPRIAALLDWEEHVARAADDALCQLLKIARRGAMKEDVDRSLNRVLGGIAMASAGTRENAQRDPFRSVHDVLGQVVMDRIVHRSSDEAVQSHWRKAVTDFSLEPPLGEKFSARLNRFLHIEAVQGSPAWERGSVVDISGLSEREFEQMWKMSRSALLGNKEGFKLASDPSCWVMVQIQAACDQAQQNIGTIPYLLGIKLVPSKNWVDFARKKGCLWVSPEFEEPGGLYRLIFHHRFVTGFDKNGVEKFGVLFRLREQILAELAFEFHSYSGRPGIVRF